MMGVLRLTPFDEATEEGRSLERYRRAAMTTAATLGIRGVQALLSLITVPLALHHYGPERYGLWLTLSSVLAVLVFADQGLGFGLVQVVARARGEEDRGAIASYSTAAFIGLGGLGFLTLGAAAVSRELVAWHEIFNVQTARAAREAGDSIIVLAAGFGLSAVAGVGPRLHQAFQEGFLANAWQLAGSLIAVVAVLLAVSTDASLGWLVAAMVGGPAVGAAAGSIYLFGRARPWLRPRFSSFEVARLRELLRVSAVFLVTQLSMAAVLAVDNFLVARAQGAAMVPNYAVPARLFYFAQTLVVLVPQALWPAYGEAIARGDDAWAMRAYRRATIASIGAAGAVALGLTVLGPWLIGLWVGPSVVVDRTLLASLGIAFVMQCGAANAMTMLAGLQALRIQVYMSVGVAVLALPLKVFALRMFGVNAIPFGAAVAFGIIVVGPSAAVIRRCGGGGGRCSGA